MGRTPSIREDDSMVAKNKAGKPKGWKKFDDLARKLTQIPKEEIDAQIERDRKARKRKRRKKKR